MLSCFAVHSSLPEFLDDPEGECEEFNIYLLRTRVEVWINGLRRVTFWQDAKTDGIPIWTLMRTEENIGSIRMIRC